MKKILSLVLVLSLVLGTFSFAFAATPEDVVDTDYEEAVETLMALGVVNGYPDGTYKPEKTLTRAEMAKLLVEALGYGDLAEGTAASFTDAQGHWAEDYVGFAAAMDIVNGYPDGTFRPDQTMTMNEAVTMVVRALGYTDDVLKGSWPTNYKVKALDLGLTEDVVVSGDASRGDTAVVLHNALEVRLVEVIKDANGLFTYEYIETNDGEDKVLLDQIGEKDDMVVDPEDVWGDDALDVADGVDLEMYLFNTITYYSTDDYEVAYVSDWEFDTVMGMVTGNDAGVLTVEDADEDEYDLDYDSDSRLYYNGDDPVDTEIEDLDVDEAEVTVVYNEDDEVIGVVAWDPDVDQISKEYTSRRELELGRWDLPEDDDELDADAVMVEGDADSLEDIEVDDVVYYYGSDGTTKVKLVVVRDTFVGKFTSRNSDGDEGTFGGDDFIVSVFSDLELDNLSEGELGDTFTLFLDKDGDVFALELADEEVTETYAVYVSEKDGSLTDDWGDLEVDTKPQVRLFTEAGDLVVYDIYTGDIDFDEEDTDDVSLGDLDLTVNFTDDGEVTVTTGSSLTKGVLVEVEMNEDGEVTSVVALDDFDYNGYDTDDMLVEDYDVTEDTVIFNISSGIDTNDEDEWEVVEASALVQNIDGYYEYSSTTFDVLAMTIENGLLESETYAVLLSVSQYYDGSDEVQRLTVYEDGEELVYYTENDDDVDPEDVDKIVKLKFDGDIVTDATPEDSYDDFEVDSVDSRRISEEDGPVYKFDSTYAVYILEDAEYSVGENADILEGDLVKVYVANPDPTPDQDLDVKVVVIDLDAMADDGDTTPEDPETTPMAISYSTPSAIDAEGLDADNEYFVRILSSDATTTLGDYGLTKDTDTTGSADITGASLVDGRVYKAQLFDLTDTEYENVLKSINFVAETE